MTDNVELKTNRDLIEELKVLLSEKQLEIEQLKREQEQLNQVKEGEFRERLEGKLDFADKKCQRLSMEKASLEGTLFSVRKRACELECKLTVANIQRRAVTNQLLDTWKTDNFLREENKNHHDETRRLRFLLERKFEHLQKGAQVLGNCDEIIEWLQATKNEHGDKANDSIYVLEIKRPESYRRDNPNLVSKTAQDEFPDACEGVSTDNVQENA